MMELRVDPGWRARSPSCRPVACCLARSCPEVNYAAVIFLPEADAACRGAAHADRIGAQDAEETGPGREDALAGPAAGTDRARCRAGSPQCPDRRDLGIDEGTVRKWRGRFAELRLAGLRDLPRCGRPRLIPEQDRAAVVALACQLPVYTGVPLSRWTGPELAAELVAQGLVSGPVSASSVLRILAENPVRPWRYRSWIFPRDPDFEAKARMPRPLPGVLPGKPLQPGDRILSADAAVDSGPGRVHATLPPRRAARCAWSTSTSGTARSRYSPASSPCTHELRQHRHRQLAHPHGGQRHVRHRQVQVDEQEQAFTRA